MATTWLLHGISCILLTCTIVAASVKLNDDDPQHASVSRRWRKDAKLTNSQRTGSLAVEVSAQTNGFLQFSDAPIEHVRARLVRSEIVHPRSTSAAAGLRMVEWPFAEGDTLEGNFWDFVPDSTVTVDNGSREGMAVHARNALLVQKALSDEASHSESASFDEELVVNSTGSLSNVTAPGENLTEADDDWSGVMKNVNSSETPAAKNATDNVDAVDNDWSAVKSGANETNETRQEPANSSAKSGASNDTDPVPIINATEEPSVNATQKEAWECYRFAAGQDANWCNTVGTEDGYQYQYNGGLRPMNCGSCYCCRRQVNATSDKASPAPPAQVNATSDKAPPAPPPVPAAAAPAPPITIINKIINKVNVTVHVNVTIPCKGANCTQDGTTVSSKADIPPVTSQAGSNKSQASKSGDASAQEDGRNPMDVWKSIVKGGRNSTKTGVRNARSDSSL